MKNLYAILSLVGTIYFAPISVLAMQAPITQKCPTHVVEFLEIPREVVVKNILPNLQLWELTDFELSSRASRQATIEFWTAIRDYLQQSLNDDKETNVELSRFEIFKRISQKNWEDLEKVKKGDTLKFFPATNYYYTLPPLEVRNEESGERYSKRCNNIMKILQFSNFERSRVYLIKLNLRYMGCVEPDFSSLIFVHCDCTGSKYSELKSKANNSFLTNSHDRVEFDDLSVTEYFFEELTSINSAEYSFCSHRCKERQKVTVTRKFERLN